jgi:hypothetical protein
MKSYELCSSLGYSCGPCIEEFQTSIQKTLINHLRDSVFRTKIHDLFVYTGHRTKTTQQCGPYGELLKGIFGIQLLEGGFPVLIVAYFMSRRGLGGLL